MNEITMRISDLLAMVLKAAKTILCFTLILALLAGGYGAYSLMKGAAKVDEADVTGAEAAAEAAKDALADAEGALAFRLDQEIPGAERRLERAKLLVQQQQAYLDNSIYHAMNPYERGVCRLTFYVETDQDAAAVALAYTQLCPFDDEVLDHVCTLLKTDAERQYVGELISVSTVSDLKTDASRQSSLSTVSDCFVQIQVIYDDAQAAEQAANYLFETMTDRLKGVVADHSVKVISTFTGYEVDWAMNDTHTANEDKLLAAQKSVVSAEASLTELQNGVAEMTQAVEDTINRLTAAEGALMAARSSIGTAKVTMKSVIKRAIKFGLVGCVLGLVAGCGIALIRGLFGGRVENQNEVRNRYPFPVIGVLPRTRKVWFDRTIRRLEGEPVGNFEATAKATAQSLLGRAGERSVCLVTTGSRDIAEKLAAYTEDRVKVLGSIIDDAASVKDLAQYDGIILVEQRGKSRMDLVDAEVLRAKALGKEVLGIVLA